MRTSVSALTSRKLAQNFRHPSIELLRDEIAKVINEDAAYSKNKANFRTQLCFAIKPGINGLLDVARKTYLETSEGTGPQPIPIVTPT